MSHIRAALAAGVLMPILILACDRASSAHQPCGTVKGRVWIVAGAPPVPGRQAARPVADATITLGPPEGGKPLASTQSGADGRFTFKCVEAGRYAIETAGQRKFVTVTANGVVQLSLYQRMM